MADVTVEWLKWPNEPYRSTPMYRLGADAAGIWLFAPRGTVASYASLGATPLPVNFLTLVPTCADWIATWMWGNAAIDIDVYVDVVTKPTWVSESTLTVVDLDLDVIRRRDGRVLIDDEDEFVENSSVRHYPADVVLSACATADEMVQVITQRSAPFGDESRRWLAMAKDQPRRQ